MSDRLGRIAVLLALAWPSALPAQRAGAWRDSAQRLAIALEALRDSLLEGDSTVLEVARREDLVISAREDLRGSATNALDRLVAVRRRWFGGLGASPSPSGFRIVLRIPPRLDGDFGVVVLTGLPDTGAATRAERVTRRGELAEALIDVCGEMM
ncbi:MAG: hypothetical protein ACT4PM_02860 [Gemmatimonadales bacterium]